MTWDLAKGIAKEEQSNKTEQNCPEARQSSHCTHGAVTMENTFSQKLCLNVVHIEIVGKIRVLLYPGMVHTLPRVH